MRVLHAPSEIAGQTSILARALRDLGVEAHSMATNPTFAQYAVDEMRPYDALPPLPRYAGYAGNLARHLLKWDVFHFHFGRTLIPPHNFDLPLYRALGKTLLFHYHGCDVRNRAHMRSAHVHSTCTECDPPFCIPARQTRILAAAARHAHAEIVSTPDLLESAPRAIQMHVAVWLPDYPVPPFRAVPRLVLHAPTHRLIKGTPWVERAFEALRPRFPGVTFRVVERVPWVELRQLMSECDVFVDQLHMGWYGMVSAEAMALGKPAMAYIRPDFEPRMKDAPIVRTGVESLTEDLAALLQDAPRRGELRERGRAYVEREHEAHVIAGHLVALYRSLGVS
jgi:hypothetical protein